MSLSPSRLYEVFLNFLHVDVMAENHHRVARFYLCITRNEHSFFTANQSTDGYTDRHAEFLHRFWVTFEPSLAINSATSALALIRNLTFITSASSIIW